MKLGIVGSGFVGATATYSLFHPDGFAANRGFSQPSKSIAQTARTNPEASTGTGAPR